MRDEICKECCPYGCDAHFEDAVKDSKRLEWLALAEVFPMNTKNGWCLTGDGVTCWTKTSDSFRGAIDEAMKGE